MVEVASKTWEYQAPSFAEARSIPPCDRWSLRDPAHQCEDKCVVGAHRKGKQGEMGEKLTN